MNKESTRKFAIWDELPSSVATEQDCVTVLCNSFGGGGRMTWVSGIYTVRNSILNLLKEEYGEGVSIL